jgi:hypothetical protein
MSQEMQALTLASEMLFKAYCAVMHDNVAEAVVRHARKHVDAQRRELLGRETE